MMLPPGTRLGPYEILARVGEGGMGVVFDPLRSEPRFAALMKKLRFAT